MRVGMEFATAAITNVEAGVGGMPDVSRLALKYGSQDLRVRIATSKVIPAALQVLVQYGEGEALAAASKSSTEECEAYTNSSD